MGLVVDSPEIIKIICLVDSSLTQKISDVREFKIDILSNKLGKTVTEYAKANYQSAGSVGI